MQYINEQLKYGYTEEQLLDIIHSVGGYGADTITVDKFNRFIERKVNKKKQGIWSAYHLLLPIRVLKD